MDLIIDEIKLLLDLFESEVPDRESNRLVWQFCDEKHRWVKAHGLHSTLRDRNNKAAKQGDRTKEAQYCFEEVIAKTLYNFTDSDAQFDTDSPYWIIKNAFVLAEAVNIPADRVVQIVS